RAAQTERKRDVGSASPRSKGHDGEQGGGALRRHGLSEPMHRFHSLLQAAAALGVCCTVKLASAETETRPATAAAPAPASPDAVEAARAFAEAQALYDGGRYERACI